MPTLIVPTDPGATTPDEKSNVDINGSANIPEALGFLKEWVTSLITIQTAAIGAIGTFLALDANAKLSTLQAVGLTLTLTAFVTSIACGGTILYMLPGCVQRTLSDRTRDIYSLSTFGSKTLGFWAPWFWFSFLAGLILFALFILVRVFHV